MLNNMLKICLLSTVLLFNNNVYCTQGNNYLNNKSNQNYINNQQVDNNLSNKLNMIEQEDNKEQYNNQQMDNSLSNELNEINNNSQNNINKMHGKNTKTEEKIGNEEQRKQLKRISEEYNEKINILSKFFKNMDRLIIIQIITDNLPSDCFSEYDLTPLTDNTEKLEEQPYKDIIDNATRDAFRNTLKNKKVEALPKEKAIKVIEDLIKAGLFENKTPNKQELMK